MSNADDLRRLAEEVKSAYEARVNFISENKQDVAAIKQGAANLLDTFGKAHKEMGAGLKAELGEFMSDLNTAESERQTSAGEDKNQRIAEKNQRSVAVGLLRKDTVRLMHDMQKAHKDMGDSLRAGLSEFISDLNTADSVRKATTRDFMKAIKTEISDAASAWKGLVVSMQIAKGAPVKTTAQIKKKAVVKPKMVKETSEEKVEDVPEEVHKEEVEDVPAEAHKEEAEAVEEKEQLRDKIIDVVSDNPDGIKMTKIAEILGIENWRTLIPVTRQLVDEDELEKEGSLYFT